MIQRVNIVLLRIDTISYRLVFVCLGYIFVNVMAYDFIPDTKSCILL